MPAPEITIMHSLPGRARLRFSQPVRSIDELSEALRSLKGVSDFTYTSVTRSALVEFDPGAVELLNILKAIVLELELEYEHLPVLVRPNTTYKFSMLTKASALGILAAAALSMVARGRALTTAVRWAATTLTAGAIMEHATGEIRRTGSFDFENLSIIYLINEIPQNYLVRGSAISWLATFSRHLIPIIPVEGLKMVVIEGVDQQNGNIYKDVAVSGVLESGTLNNVRIQTNKDLKGIRRFRKAMGLNTKNQQGD